MSSHAAGAHDHHDRPAAQAPAGQILRGPQPRLYQAKAIDALAEAVARALAARVRARVLLVSPTGSGKTVMFARVIERARARGSSVLFVAHRKELIDQTSRKLDDVQVDHGVIMAGHERINPALPVQVASVQTLARREQWPKADIIIIDEAHHARARTYQTIIDHYPQAVILGGTATPWRTDGRGLGELFTDLVVAAHPRELIEQGHLVPYSGFAYDCPDLVKVPRRGADYDQAGLELVMGSRKLVGNIVEQWQAHAAGKRTIVFAVNVAHSRALAERFRLAGAEAEHLDGTTETGLREAILGRLASGATKVVCNVGVLTEGFDCPSVECVVLAKPTLSLALALQMPGRGLRPSPGTGKTQCLIHDHAGIFIEHGAPDAEREYRLDADTRCKGASGPPPLRTCKKCKRIYDPAADGQACPACGTVNGLSRQESKAIQEITENVRATPLHELPQFSQASAEEKLETLRKLQATAAERGYSPKWADVQFKIRFKEWPPRSAA